MPRRISRGSAPAARAYTRAWTRTRGIHERISELIEQERRLRDDLSGGRISPDEEHTGLQDVEVQLDQCWDLLRQREALRNAGRDPANADVRPPGTVEGYLG